MSSSSILALDVGDSRIGVAVAGTVARLASPLATLTNDEAVFGRLQALASEHEAVAFVVGVPRNLRGSDTGQTEISRSFAERLGRHAQLPVYLVDEALTSRQAEAELRSRRKHYEKADIDALAAVYILEDYLQNEGAANV